MFTLVVGVKKTEKVQETRNWALPALDHVPFPPPQARKVDECLHKQKLVSLMSDAEQ